VGSPHRHDCHSTFKHTIIAHEMGRVPVPVNLIRAARNLPIKRIRVPRKIESTVVAPRSISLCQSLLNDLVKPITPAVHVEPVVLRTRALMRAARRNDAVEAQKEFDSMIADGIQPTPITYHALMSYVHVL